ncbi:MAG: DUF5677 domain-containing protein [Flammeovirgaceae bacterium]
MTIHNQFFIENLLKKKVFEAKRNFKGTEKQFKREVSKKINDSILSLNEAIRKGSLKGGFLTLKHTNKHKLNVKKKIETRYKSSLRLFDVFLELNSQIGRTFYTKYRKLFKDYDSQLKLDALVEIHSRAIQIAHEINLLVKNGYSDGAYARWRSIHELSIIFLFLYDTEQEVTQMYLDYEVIEAWDRLKKYREAKPKELGFQSVSRKEINSLSRKRDSLIVKYGNDFSKSYGWTMKVLPKEKRTIRGIEEFVRMDRLRGVYSSASENVHAGISGNRNRLGLPNTKKLMFLAGPSEHGLIEPVQFTMYSITEIASAMLSAEDSILNNLLNIFLLDFHEFVLKDFEKHSGKKP